MRHAYAATCQAHADAASWTAGATHPDLEQVETTLRSVGFTDVMLKSPVAALSGGWKMKLALGAPQPHPRSLLLLALSAV